MTPGRVPVSSGQAGGKSEKLSLYHCAVLRNGFSRRGGRRFRRQGRKEIILCRRGCGIGGKLLQDAFELVFTAHAGNLPPVRLGAMEKGVKVAETGRQILSKPDQFPVPSEKFSGPGKFLLKF